MGETKHGKDSARAKKCKRYKDEGRLILNKKATAEKVKKSKFKRNKKKHLEKTWDMKMNTFLRNAKQTKPVVDPNFGTLWGTDIEHAKEVVAKRNKSTSKSKVA